MHLYALWPKLCTTYRSFQAFFAFHNHVLVPLLLFCVPPNCQRCRNWLRGGALQRLLDEGLLCLRLLVGDPDWAMFSSWRVYSNTCVASVIPSSMGETSWAFLANYGSQCGGRIVRLLDHGHGAAKWSVLVFWIPIPILGSFLLQIHELLVLDFSFV